MWQPSPGRDKARPGAAGPRAGDLRRAGPARPRPGRHREDQRPAGPGPRLDRDGGRVLGLAPSAAAAAVLREQLSTGTGTDPDTDTVAKLVHALRTGVAVPEWVRAVGPGSLVVIDEAGMAGTAELADTVRFVTGRGGSVRLIGDDRQLAAV